MYGPTVAGTPDVVNTHRREVRSFPSQRTFLREGEAQSYVFTLYSGWAFRYTTLRDGRRQIFFFHVPGDIIALESLTFPGISLPFSVKSLTPVTLCAFDVKEANSLVRTTKFQQDRSAVTMQRFFSDLHRRIADIGRRSAMGRISQLLVEIEGRLRRRQLSKNGTFAFPVRQEHLADALGLTTVYVNRTLDKLRKQKLIAFDRHRMTILDLERLHEIAEEE